MPKELPPKTKAELLLERGIRAFRNGRITDAARTYGEVLEFAGTDGRQWAIALFNRGLVRQCVGNKMGAIEDWSRVIEAPSAPVWLMCRCYLARAMQRMKLGDNVGAVCDCTALLNQAAALGTHQDATADSGVFIDLSLSPLRLLCTARINRGSARFDLCDIEGSAEDAIAALHTDGISNGLKARALTLLSECLLLSGKFMESAAAASQALKLRPNFGACRCVLGLALAVRGQIEPALQEIAAGLEWVRNPETISEMVALLVKLEGKARETTDTNAVLSLLLSRRNALETRAR
jgi:tetratricopeptide (TPR) repeat protein